MFITGYRSDYQLTKYILLLTYNGELLGVFCRYFREKNKLCYVQRSDCSQIKACCPGPCITAVIWHCRNPFSQWEPSFHRKLRSHWPKVLRQRYVAIVVQGPGKWTILPDGCYSADTWYHKPYITYQFYLTFCSSGLLLTAVIGILQVSSLFSLNSILRG